MIVGASLITAVFLPFGLTLHPLASLALFLVKIFVVVALISLVRSLFARLRIDQMMRFCLKYLTSVALLQLLINIFLKGFLYK